MVQRKRTLLPLLVGLLISGGHPAVAAENVLRVGVVDDQAPCSDVDRTLVRGSAVDIWHQVASRADLRFRFISYAKPDEAIRAAANDRIDLAVSCFNITPFRIQEVLFTTPYGDDGLSLLSKRQPKSFVEILRKLLTSPVIRDSSLLLLLLGLGFAAILWIASSEFRHKDIVGDTKKHTFYKGWMMLAMGTGIYKMGSAPVSMSIIALNNFVRLVVTSIFVAAATAVVLEASAPADLADSDTLKAALEKKIGVDADTVAQAWLEKSADQMLNVEAQLRLIVPFQRSTDLVSSLEKGIVGSIMADSASIALLQRQLDNPDDYEILGQTFYRTPQAFAAGSRLDPQILQRINVALGELKFEGEVDNILQRWQPPKKR